MVLYSDEDKFIKLAWLYRRSNTTFSSLQIQKFLFFYEMFSKINDEEYNIKSLQAWANGPVFSNVYGDYVYDRPTLIEKIENITDDALSVVCDKTASMCQLVIESMTENELSDFTHNFDLWKTHKPEIDEGVKQIPIVNEDISEKDLFIMKELYNYYEKLYDLGYKSIRIADKVFMVSEENADDITGEHAETLDTLSRKDYLENPVFLDIDRVNGKEVLLVD